MLLYIAGDRSFMHRFSVNLLTYNSIPLSRIFCGWTAQIWILSIIISLFQLIAIFGVLKFCQFQSTSKAVIEHLVF